MTSFISGETNLNLSLDKHILLNGVFR